MRGCKASKEAVLMQTRRSVRFDEKKNPELSQSRSRRGSLSGRRRSSVASNLSRRKMDTLDHSRPLSRRSEDSGLALSIGSSRGSSPVDLKLDLSSSTFSLNSSTGSSPIHENPRTLKKFPNSSLQRSKSNVSSNSNGGLKKKLLVKPRMKSEEIQPRYKSMKSITMEVKKSSFGRKGWIAKPVDETLDIGQLALNGALEKLINDLRVMELSGKDIPKMITIRLGE